MKRRSLLLLIGASSGCLGTIPSRNPLSSDRTLEDVSVSGLGDSELSITSDIIEPDITAKKTAKFEIVVEWKGKEPIEYDYGNSIPFSEPKYSDEPKGVILLSSPNSYQRQNNKTWLPKTDDTGYVGGRPSAGSAKLSYGETISGKWEVWADPQNASFIKTGTYTFENADVIRGNRVNWELKIKIA